MDSKHLAWLDAVPALISLIDASRRYQTCNRAYYAWFGLTQDQVIGHTMQEVLGDAAWQRLQPHVDAVLTGETRDFEIEVPYRLGGKRWIHAVYTPHRDETGRVTGFVVLVTEITKRKHAERELARSEERFRAFVTTSSAVVYRMSPDWSEMRQLDGKDFIADTPDPSRSWLMKYIHPDDQGLVTDAINSAIRHKSIFELRHRVIRVDGSLGWTFSRAIPLMNERGEITEWFGAAYDVTEQQLTQDALRASEERYRSLFESIDEGFCVIEMIFNDAGQPVDYKFVEVNPAFEQHTGLRQPTGKRMGDYVAHMEPVWPERYGRVATTGESLRFTEGELLALLVARRALQQYAGTPFHRQLQLAFEKLTGGLTDKISFSPAAEFETISFKSIGAGRTDLEVFNALSAGVLKQHIVAFLYRKAGRQEAARRQVCPYHLAHRENQWYLIGKDEVHGEVRTFAVARIKDVQVTSRRFVRPTTFSPDAIFANALSVLGGKESYVIKIRFSAAGAEYIRDRQWHESQSIQELSDGGLVLTLRLGALTEIERWVLGWGAKAQVLEPVRLRERITRTIRSLEEIYQQPPD